MNADNPIPPISAKGAQSSRSSEESLSSDSKEDRDWFYTLFRIFGRLWRMVTDESARLIPLKSERTSLDEVAKTALATVENKPPTPTEPKSVAQEHPSSEEFLRQMRDSTEQRAKDFDTDMRQLRQRESLVFGASLVAAVVTFALAVGGALLIFAHQIAVGILIESVGVITGGGTILFLRLAAANKRERNTLQELRDDNVRALQAIQGALLVAEPKKRDVEIARLAAWLRERASRA